VAVLLTTAPLIAARAQTRPAPTADPVATSAGGRPIPGPVYESVGFTNAVERATRTRNGIPGPHNWVQHPRYAIQASLDVQRHRIAGRETVIYRNDSADSLPQLAVHLRQNAFAAGSPRGDPAPITGGVTLGRVSVDGRAVPAAAGKRPSEPGRYAVDGTVMWIALAQPLRAGDSLRLEVTWSYSPPPAPSDGRQGREDRLYFMGYWYPQIAVYDDVSGWVADPYLLGAEFYMDPADYDVKVTVPRGWVVGATGTLVNADAILSRAARDSLAAARTSGRVVRVLTPDSTARRAFVGGTTPTATWHFTASNVRDFAWGTSNRYAWDATRALVGDDTVDISSFFRRSGPAAAWERGGARFTRDAVQQLSLDLWPYPYPQMTSMEGVLDGGGMEYPMLTLMQPWADTLALAGDLMHETGHMWFPMQVGSNETRYPWMDEGFTQFNTAQAMRVLYGEPRRAGGGRANDAETGQRASYLRAARAGDDTPLMISGDDYPAGLYYVMNYNKTAQVLAALRAVLGPATFRHSFVAYGRLWVGRHPQPYDFFNTIATAAHRDLSWFWTTWFYQGWPLDQAIDSVTPAGDSVAITIADRALAPMPVLLAVTRTGGTVQRVEIPVDGWLAGKRRVTVRVAREPRIVRVEIDPDSLFPDVDRANQVWTQ
jgi:hypothetical protein